VIARTLLIGLPFAVSSAELRVTVTQPDGRALGGAVVIVEPAAPVPAELRTHRNNAVMDQRKLQFVPDILVVRTGTSVDFPNSDQVLHQVYSFSGAKKFQLSLYAGRQHDPVIFDKPGLVVLGCNIHDNMIGYIYVTDSPWFGRTNEQGALTLELPAGRYTVSVQHPRVVDSPAALRSDLRVEGTAVQRAVRISRPLKPPLHAHTGDKNWEDY
jgi:plastocyanin